MAQEIISGFSAPGDMAGYGAHGMKLVLDLDATLKNLEQRLSLTAEEQLLLEQIADGTMTGEELPPELRAKLAQIPDPKTLEAMMVHDVGDATVTATSMIEDNVGGNAQLAEMIATHPQAEFIWGKNALQTLTAMSLRQQLAIVTKYWGGCRETANQLAELGPEKGGLSQADANSFQCSWDNFNRRLISTAPNVDLILRVWDGKSPECFALDYPLPVLSQLILRQPQLTDVERADIQQLPARALRTLFINIYHSANKRSSRKQTKKIKPIIWPSLFDSNYQFISSKVVQDICDSYSTARYRLDGKRPLPELAKAMARYFRRSRIDVPETLQETASLQTLSEILFENGLGGRALTTQMRAAEMDAQLDQNFWQRIDRARMKIFAYWSDDWGLVAEYMKDERNCFYKDPLQKNLANNRDEIIDAYKYGESLRRIGQQFECSASTIVNFLRSEDVVIRRPRTYNRFKKGLSYWSERSAQPEHPQP